MRKHKCILHESKETFPHALPSAMAACLARNRKTHMLFSADNDVMQCEQARSFLRIPQYDYNIIKSARVNSSPD